MNPDDVKPKIDPTYTPPSDPSAYIRTYAKDVAMLTKTPPPTPPTAPARAVTSSDGVDLPEYDASPIEHKDNPSSPKEFKAEVVALSENDSEGIFNSPQPSAPAPIAVPLMPQASIGQIPIVAPKETQEEREAILARLRAKLASHTPPAPAPPQPIAPQFIQPVEAPVAPLPVREQSVPVIPPPVAKPLEANPSPIHTFSSDFSDRIDSQKASTFSVLASQSDARPARVSASKTRSRLIPIIAGVVLLLCGSGAVAGAFIYNAKNNEVPMVAGVPSLLTFDESVEVKGSGPALIQAIADVAGQASVMGNIVVTYVTAPGATGGSIPQQGGVLIKELALGAPDILMRNIADSSTVGTIHAGTESRPFVVLRVNSYERTFAGMLAWEPSMVTSLSVFFPAYTDTFIAPVATTSTSTPVLPVTLTPASPFFSDAYVANHDVRILKDSMGRSIMLYGYYGKDTLVLARDEAAFTALIGRLTSTATP